MKKKKGTNKATAAVKTAVLYARVSTVEQVEDGTSLAAQAKMLQSYCALRGYNVLAHIEDAGVSAGKPLENRPGGAELLGLVGSGQITHVIAVKLDRLFRNCRDCLAVTAQWDKLGVSLHLVDLGGQSLDTSSAIGRFFLTVMAGAAEFERNLVAERTRAAMQHLKSERRRVGQVPYGFQLDPDGAHLIEAPAEQAVIAQVRSLRQAGYTVRAIAERLNITDTPARGSRWHPTTVARLLRRQTDEQDSETAERTPNQGGGCAKSANDATGARLAA